MAFFSAAAILFFTGCANVGPQATKATVAKTAEEAVRERAQARWDALIARKVDVAYGFISPATRTTLTLEVYFGRVNPQFWRKTQVRQVVCEPEICDVTLDLDFTVNNMQLSKQISEKWILADGNWWFVYQG